MRDKIFKPDFQLRSDGLHENQAVQVHGGSIASPPVFSFDRQLVNAPAVVIHENQMLRPQILFCSRSEQVPDYPASIQTPAAAEGIQTPLLAPDSLDQL